MITIKEDEEIRCVSCRRYFLPSHSGVYVLKGQAEYLVCQSCHTLNPRSWRLWQGLWRCKRSSDGNVYGIIVEGNYQESYEEHDEDDND